MTNFDKLVRWDAGFYKTLDNTDCIICVTEREVYLIGQIIDALRWKRTRWVGDLTGLDFDEIASTLEAKIADRMTCQSVTQLLQKLEQLEQKIDYIFSDTATDNGDYVPTSDSAPYDRFTPEAYDEAFTFATDGCDTEDKDALYSGIREFVNYVHQNNLDALENIGQSVGNVAQQAERFMSGVPGLGLLPFDEVAGYISFLADELKDEYEATVNQTLLDAVICDLFCIAVNSGCRFNLSDAVHYFSDKITGDSILDLYSDIAQVVNFAAIGSFSGDDYFYYMCVFQFIAVAVADHYFNAHGQDSYVMRVATGLNSPDNDWTILCVECPPMYRKFTYDFSRGASDWYLDDAVDTTPPGEHTGDYWQGTPDPSHPRMRIATLINPSWNIISISVEPEWTFLSHGGARALALRPTAGSIVGQTSNQVNGTNFWCGNPPIGSGFNEIALDAFVSNAAGYVRVKKITIVYDIDAAPHGATVTSDDDLCD